MKEITNVTRPHMKRGRPESNEEQSACICAVDSLQHYSVHNTQHSLSLSLLAIVWALCFAGRFPFRNPNYHDLPSELQEKIKTHLQLDDRARMAADRKTRADLAPGGTKNAIIGQDQLKVTHTRQYSETDIVNFHQPRVYLHWKFFNKVKEWPVEMVDESVQTNLTCNFSVKKDMMDKSIQI